MFNFRELADFGIKKVKIKGSFLRSEEVVSGDSLFVILYDKTMMMNF